MWKTDEIRALVYFLVEKSREATSTLCIKHISKEFSMMPETKRTANGVESKILNLRKDHFVMEEIDEETRELLMNALAPPTPSSCQRAPFAKWGEKEQKNLVKFLVERSKKPEPVGISQLAREYAERFETKRTMGALMKKIFNMRSEIENLEELDEQTKSNVISILSTPDDAKGLSWSEEEKNELVEFLAEKSKKAQSFQIAWLAREFLFRKNTARSFASVTSRITILRDSMETIENIDDETKDRITLAFASSDDARAIPWSIQEDQDLAQFIFEKSEEESVISFTQLAKEYTNTDRTFRSSQGVSNRIFAIRNRIHSFQHIDITDRERLTAVLGIMSTQKIRNWNFNEYNSLVSFLVDKSINATFPINMNALPSEFKSRFNPSCSLDTICLKINEIRNNIQDLNLDYFSKERMMFALNPSPKPPTPGQNDPILEFLAEISEGRETPIDDFEFLNEYNGYKRFIMGFDLISLAQYQKSKRQIAMSEKYDLKTKLKMMFVASVPVPPGFVEKFQKDQIVELDEYKLVLAGDGTLVLDTNTQDLSRKRPFPMTSSSEPTLKIPKIEDDFERDVKLEEPDF